MTARTSSGDVLVFLPGEREIRGWQQALEAGYRATKTADDPHNAWYSLATLHARQNDYLQTEQCLRQAIASSPNWFKPHWMLAQVLMTKGHREQVLAEARLDPDPTFQIDPHKLDLNETVDSLNAHGVKIDNALPGDTPAVLIYAEQQDGPAYRVGFKNFYVITRYNGSARYAMSVHDLARAIVQRVHGGQP